MKLNTKLRLLASKGGAFVASAIYAGTLLLLSLFKVDLASLPGWVNTLIVPAAAFINSPSDVTILGVSINLVIASLGLYAALGFLVDWIHDPYK